MTNRQALAAARRRWGPKAAVTRHRDRCRVGFVALGLFFEVCGEGPTWEEAFKASPAAPGPRPPAVAAAGAGPAGFTRRDVEEWCVDGKKGEQ